MNKLFKFAFSKIKGVKVYALVGKSGTGKSHHSKIVARKYNLDLIIDDGLLIKGDKILAGKSAKKDLNFLQAVKTAVFALDDHKNSIVSALLKEKYKKILIIGTSEKMVNKIAQRLELPQITKILQIEDVSTKEDIERAMRIRYTEGKHVIPVPSIEITRSYPQIVYDSIKVLFKRVNPLQKNRAFEKTIVLPEFSKPIKEKFSENAMYQKVIHCIDDYDKIIKVKKVYSKEVAENLYDVQILLQIPIKHYMGTTVGELKLYIKENIERYSNIKVNSIDLEVEN